MRLLTNVIARSPAGRLVFDRQAEGRAKTGRAAIGTVSKRAERLGGTDLGQSGAERLRRCTVPHANGPRLSGRANVSRFRCDP
jgi:hypothetical protein